MSAPRLPQAVQMKRRYGADTSNISSQRPLLSEPAGLSSLTFRHRNLFVPRARKCESLIIPHLISAPISKSAPLT